MLGAIALKLNYSIPLVSHMFNDFRKSLDVLSKLTFIALQKDYNFRSIIHVHREYRDALC